MACDKHQAEFSSAARSRVSGMGEETNRLNTARVWPGSWQSHNRTILAWKRGSAGLVWEVNKGTGYWLQRSAVTGLVKSCLYQPFSKEPDDKYSRDQAGCGGRVREGVWFLLHHLSQTYLSVVTGGICLDWQWVTLSVYLNMNPSLKLLVRFHEDQ